MNSTNNQNTFSIRSVLEMDKLNGSNFLTWSRNLRLVLRQERKDYVLEKALPVRIGSNASHAVYNAWNKHYNVAVDVRDLILATMDSDLREQYENMESPIEMISSLKLKFQEQVRVERYQLVKSLTSCKLPNDHPVSPHVSKMMGYIDNLRKLDYPVSQELATEIILQSLPSSYDKFRRNYIKKGLTKTLTELHDMLKTVEPNVKSTLYNLMNEKGRFTKPNADKGEDKVVQILNHGKRVSSEPESDTSYVGKCCYCKETGHWKRNCIKFMEDDEELKLMYETTSSGIHVITSSSTL